MSISRLDSFWDIISKASSVLNLVGTNPLPGQVARYNGYYLNKSLNPQPHGLDDKTMTIDQWIQKAIREEPRSNFLFARKVEGPDLMFFLSHGTKKILCAVQVRDLEPQL